MNKTKPTKKKAPKLSKYEQIVNRKNQALKLLKQMDKVAKQQDRVINEWQDSMRKNKQAGRRKINDNFYSKLNAQLDKQNDELYSKYYHHVNKDVNPNKSSVNFLNYKDRFMDEKYINDIYNEKLLRCKQPIVRKKSIKR